MFGLQSSTVGFVLRFDFLDPPTTFELTHGRRIPSVSFEWFSCFGVASPCLPVGGADADGFLTVFILGFFKKVYNFFFVQVQLDLARLDKGGMTQNGHRQSDNSGKNCGESDNDNCHDDGDGNGDGDDDDDTLLNRQAKMLSL